MAWSNSKGFAFFQWGLGRASYKVGNTPDTFKVSLFGNSVVPTNKYGTATKTKTKYHGTGGTFSTTNGAGGATGKVAKTLASVTWTQVTNVLHFKAANVTWTTATITTAYGDLVYDSSHTTYGVCYNYFGGAFTSTAGTFTISWNTTGIYKVTC
jgi:hypothetical protein